MTSIFQDIAFAVRRKCPVCKIGDMFDSWFNFTPKETCDHCGAKLKAQDVGDGAIVFLTFLLGFTVIPGALVWEFISAPSIWLQAIVWSVVSIFFIFALTPIIKAYIMTLQLRHRKSDWKK